MPWRQPFSGSLNAGHDSEHEQKQIWTAARGAAAFECLVAFMGRPACGSFMACGSCCVRISRGIRLPSGLRKAVAAFVPHFATALQMGPSRLRRGFQLRMRLHAGRSPEQAGGLRYGQAFPPPRRGLTSTISTNSTGGGVTPGLCRGVTSTISTISTGGGVFGHSQVKV